MHLASITILAKMILINDSTNNNFITILKA